MNIFLTLADPYPVPGNMGKMPIQMETLAVQRRISAGECYKDGRLFGHICLHRPATAAYA